MFLLKSSQCVTMFLLIILHWPITVIFLSLFREMAMIGQCSTQYGVEAFSSEASIEFNVNKYMPNNLPKFKTMFMMLL